MALVLGGWKGGREEWGEEWEEVRAFLRGGDDGGAEAESRVGSPAPDGEGCGATEVEDSSLCLVAGTREAGGGWVAEGGKAVIVAKLRAAEGGRGRDTVASGGEVDLGSERGRC